MSSNRNPITGITESFADSMMAEFRLQALAWGLSGGSAEPEAAVWLSAFDKHDPHFAARLRELIASRNPKQFMAAILVEIADASPRCQLYPTVDWGRA